MPIIVSEENKKTKVLDSSVVIEVIGGDPIDEHDQENKKIRTGDATATTEDILVGKTAYAKGIKLTGTYHPLDTTDATAIANDLVYGKTAYVNGEKIIGTISDYSNVSTGTRWGLHSDAMIYDPNGNTLFLQLYGLYDSYKIVFNNTNFQITDIPGSLVAERIGLTSDKIKDGETILGIEGQLKDTTDATATAADIRKDKTAYVNNEKITGRIPFYPHEVGVSGIMVNDVSLNFDRTDHPNDVYVRLTNPGDSIILDQYGCLTGIYPKSQVANSIRLTPEKLMKGETILGVTGTLQGPTLQPKVVTPTTSQQIITPDENYNGLSQVTVNAVDSSIDSNIQSENIKKGKTILGVEGTYIGEAVNAIYSLEYNTETGDLYSVASDGSTRTPYELEDGNLIIYTGDDDILAYDIVDKCLEVVIDG